MATDYRRQHPVCLPLGCWPIELGSVSLRYAAYGADYARRALGRVKRYVDVILAARYSTWIKPVSRAKPPGNNRPTSSSDSVVLAHQTSADGPRAVRLKDIAVLAGVSPITVSRALSRPDIVAEATVARVRAVVERLGYVPNRHAGSLASNRSQLVAAVVPTIANAIFSDTLLAFTSALDARGYQVMFGLSGFDGDSEARLLENVLGRRPDGILLTGARHTARTRMRLAAAGIPIVETWDTSEEPLDMTVGFSHRDVGHALGQHLLDCGCRRPALILGDNDRAAARGRGFKEACAERGYTSVPEKVLASPTTTRQGREALRELLAESPDIDAVSCSSDLLALGAIIEAGQRGIDVPGDLSVAGFGDLDFASQLEPALTTVRIDGQGIGRLAALNLLERIEKHVASGNGAPKQVDVGFELVARASTRPRPHKPENRR
ncbi:LacI family DNA-binding transcriptional regulator [Candidimonas humi]|uniref:LacI family DNA-binding transcriptional regulator n=1 Tax=Candidimonas humi TaxID=683355 RepID=A0ABV8P1V9_9BURK|nr:LacI family DNA-binding transcriptional regulator [Candidimonas humi]MBV6306737.1 LacI family DNA-binding transcriptional regulator [Candidimonas humi]